MASQQKGFQPFDTSKPIKPLDKVVLKTSAGVNPKVNSSQSEDFQNVKIDADKIQLAWEELIKNQETLMASIKQVTSYDGKMDNEDELESLQDNLEEQIFNDLMTNAENEEANYEEVNEKLMKL